MFSDDEDDPGGAHATHSRKSGRFISPTSRPRGSSPLSPTAPKRPRGASPTMPATTASDASRVVGSLAALMDSGKQHGKRYGPLHRSEQATILIALATVELAAVVAHGAAAAAAAGGDALLLSLPRKLLRGARAHAATTRPRYEYCATQNTSATPQRSWCALAPPPADRGTCLQHRPRAARAITCQCGTRGPRRPRASSTMQRHCSSASSASRRPPSRRSART
mmetsp:Transcript_7909/g.28067  ORF Transcript_7909/g.28067 Transcript_7909/m.28067 type:complete len:223 (-) Transcript_7909:1339-2007(-)